MVALIPWQLQLLYVPSIDQSWSLGIGKADVVPADPSEEFLLVEVASTALLGFPPFELPVIARTNDGDDPAPFRVREAHDGIVDVKDNLTAADLLLDGDGLRTL